MRTMQDWLDSYSGDHQNPTNRLFHWFSMTLMATIERNDTATRQLGHWPAQHSRPRRRWYLKLRENVRTPAAKSAEPIVSPARPVTSRPSKLNRTDPSVVGSEAGASDFSRPAPETASREITTSTSCHSLLDGRSHSGTLALQSHLSARPPLLERLVSVETALKWPQPGAGRPGTAPRSRARRTARSFRCAATIGSAGFYPR